MKIYGNKMERGDFFLRNEYSNKNIIAKLRMLKDEIEERGGQVPAKLLGELKKRYENEMEPTYAAARLWVDDIIDPLETGELISLGIESVNNNPEIPKLNVGASQT